MWIKYPYIHILFWVADAELLQTNAELGILDNKILIETQSTHIKPNNIITYVNVFFHKFAKVQKGNWTTPDWWTDKATKCSDCKQ